LVLDQFGNEINAADPTKQSELALPAAESAFTVRVQSQGQQFARNQGRAPEPTSLFTFDLPNGRELMKIDWSSQANQNWLGLGNQQERLTVDKRVIFDAISNRLVIIPFERDSVVSRRLDIKAAFDKLDGPPAITTPTLLWASSGKDFRHQIKVHSLKSPLTFRLTGKPGAAGPSLASDGILTWKVPSRSEGKEVAAVVTIRDAGGEESTAVLRILVR
jgi:hypothetical protein